MATQPISMNIIKQVLIDSAGERLCYKDSETGVVVFVETYVAILPYSGYTFIPCVVSQCIMQFLMAAVKALEIFIGVPMVLVPYNLKAALKKGDRHDLDLTEGMNDLANHYMCDV